MISLLLACATVPSPALEARVAALEQANAELAARLDRTEEALALRPADDPDLALRGLELRVQALEQAGPRPAAADAHPGLPAVTTDPETGALIPVLGVAAMPSCAREAAQGLITVQHVFDGAFDRFEADLEALGWDFHPASGCHHYLAVAVTAIEPRDVVVEVVITRGDGRGRHFRAHLDGEVVEVDRLDEAGIGTFLSDNDWAGSAR